MVTFVNENVSAQLIGLQKPTQITDSEQQAHKTPLEKYHNDNYDIPDSGKIELTDKPPTNSSPAVTIPKESVPDEPIEPSCYPLENPYPEDTAPVQRDNAALSLPPRRYRSTHQTKGVVIGTQASTDLREVAWLATVLEAAKFQALRGQLQILPTDLRSYRRSALAEQLLVLLLDYTCLRDCQWQAALLPHLRRAYMDHANICLIQVGVADAQHELRAQRLTAKNLLVPRINKALNANAGKATPLAHGLELALLTLRQNLQHGRNTVQKATLIVLTDGRGNVPLPASIMGEITPPVHRKGIEDAIKVAQKIYGMHNLYSVLLNPQPQIYADLPLELADALGAVVEDIDNELMK